MEKQTKNIITRELIEKELRFYNTADIRSTLVFCGALAFFLLPLAFGLVYAILSLNEAVLLKIVFSFTVGTILSLPVWMNLLPLRKYLIERRLLSRGEFYVTTRPLLYKSEKIVHRHTEEFLHFEDFKEVSVGHTIFQLTSQGDEFYIVHYQTKKVVKLLYSSKMYEYKDK